MQRKKATLFLFLLITTFSMGQFVPEKSYDFHPPLKIPLVLAANFGELRSNHFHTGIDFKTNRKIGYDIHSIDDGYVSRIKVSPWGYGHVVYIDHYNGLTSVYAHCSAFTGDLADLVATQQEKQENFAFDYYPTKDSLKVKKGEVIALSGNTGGSTAPHLHFEIRETKTEHALNPLLFGFDIKDTQKPTIRSMKVYALDEHGYRVPGRETYTNVSGGNGNFAISGNKITVPANYTSKTGGIGFAFDAIDQLDAASNICGIHEAFLIVDGDTLYSQDMTEISFHTNRYINSHKDYEDYHRRRRHYQKTFKTVHNPLPIYRTLKNNGILKTIPGAIHDVKYICKDAYGNTSALRFELVIESGNKSDLSSLFSPTEKYLFPDSAFMDISDAFSILFPPGLIYEPEKLILNHGDFGLQFGKSATPLQESFRLMLKIENQDLPKEKYLVSRTNDAGYSYAHNGTVNNSWITTWVRDFGKFEVAVDTLSPEIFYRNFATGQNVRGKKLIWKIRDNFSGVYDYDVFIDGKWHLLSYEPKGGGHYYFTPSSGLNGTKELLIRVVDHCGNQTEEKYSVVF